MAATPHLMQVASLTPGNSLSVTPQAMTSGLTPDVLLFEQIRQQFQNHLQLQEQYQMMAQQETEAQQAAQTKETMEELMQRHGFIKN